MSWTRGAEHPLRLHRGGKTTGPQPPFRQEDTRVSQDGYMERSRFLSLVPWGVGIVETLLMEIEGGILTASPPQARHETRTHANWVWFGVCRSWCVEARSDPTHNDLHHDRCEGGPGSQ